MDDSYLASSDFLNFFVESMCTSFSYHTHVRLGYLAATLPDAQRPDAVAAACRNPRCAPSAWLRSFFHPFFIAGFRLFKAPLRTIFSAHLTAVSVTCFFASAIPFLATRVEGPKCNLGPVWGRPLAPKEPCNDFSCFSHRGCWFILVMVL